MALIYCPECGTQVSDKALDCPRCGFPIAKQDGISSDESVRRKEQINNSEEESKETIKENSNDFTCGDNLADGVNDNVTILKKEKSNDKTLHLCISVLGSIVALTIIIVVISIINENRSDITENSEKITVEDLAYESSEKKNWVKQVEICLYNEVKDKETKEVLKNGIVADLYFPFTINEARDMSGGLQSSIYLDLVHQSYEEKLNAIKGGRENYRETNTSPHILFREAEYDDYEWRYGEPSLAYCDMFAITPDSYSVSVNGIRVIQKK